VILPGAAFTEKDGTYVNTEGRVQYAERPSSRRATRARTGRSCAPGRCAGVSVGFDSFDELRIAMIADVPALGAEAGRLRRAARRSCRGEGGRRDRLSDQGSLPHQRDLPRQPHFRCSAELLHGESFAEAAE
jgi:NADH-quinone oxidoreductase subunit G